MENSQNLGEEEEQEYVRAQLSKIERELAKLEAEKRKMLSRMAPSTTNRPKPMLPRNLTSSV